jgi:sec-independent protein translocase protein TatB
MHARPATGMPAASWPPAPSRPRVRARVVARLGRRCYRGRVFGIGPTEFIIIAVMALLLFSPRELPKMLRSAAKFWGSLRNTADEFRDAIMNEEELQSIRGVLQGTAKDIKTAEAAARRELMKARMEMQKAQNKLLKTVKAGEEAKRAELATAAQTDPLGAATLPEGTSAAATPAAAIPGEATPGETSPVEVTVTNAANVQAAAPEPSSPAPHGTVAVARPGAPAVDRDQGAA